VTAEAKRRNRPRRSPAPTRRHLLLPKSPTAASNGLYARASSKVVISGDEMPSGVPRYLHPDPRHRETFEPVTLGFWSIVRAGYSGDPRDRCGGRVCERSCIDSMQTFGELSPSRAGAAPMRQGRIATWPIALPWISTLAPGRQTLRDGVRAGCRSGPPAGRAAHCLPTKGSCPSWPECYRDINLLLKILLCSVLLAVLESGHQPCARSE
jgi:hypothetical protein